MRHANIKSNFALLDVKAGRKALFARFKGNPQLRVPVTITGFITGSWSDDDGVSREFQVDVEAVTVTEAE